MNYYAYNILDNEIKIISGLGSDSECQIFDDASKAKEAGFDVLRGICEPEFKAAQKLENYMPLNSKYWLCSKTLRPVPYSFSGMEISIFALSALSWRFPNHHEAFSEWVMIGRQSAEIDRQGKLLQNRFKIISIPKRFFTLDLSAGSEILPAKLNSAVSYKHRRD